VVRFHHSLTLSRFEALLFTCSVLSRPQSNKAPEPTTRLVTPRAEPRVAPSRVVAHL
jgi:hypothetical protein